MPQNQQAAAVSDRRDNKHSARLTAAITLILQNVVAEKLFAAGLALLALMLATPAYANTVYSQAPVGNDLANTNNNSFVSTYNNGTLVEQWVFDNFIPSQSGTISNITWQGGAQPINNPNDTSNGFVIKIYDTLPMTDPEISTTLPLVTFNVPGNANQTQVAPGSTLYNFSYNLTTPFTLNANKSYWITIYATDVSGYNANTFQQLTWAWNTGSGGNTALLTETVIVGQTYKLLSGGHRAFSLNDTAVTSTLGAGEVNLAYSKPLAGVSATTIKLDSANNPIISGTLPPGLTVDPTGTLIGTPQAAGSYNFTVAGTATDYVFDITIIDPVIVATTTLPDGTVGASYTPPITLSVNGGASPYTWSVNGTLPNGMTFDKTGLLSGTPTQTGAFPLTFNVTDALNAQNSQPITLTIGAVPTPPVQASYPLGNGEMGLPYCSNLANVSSANGSQLDPTTSLPPGLNLDLTTGILSGTPTAAGLYTFKVNGAGRVDTFSITILPSVTVATTALPVGTADTAYTATLSAVNGTPNTGLTYNWSIIGGAPALPPGLTFSTSGVLSGTPTAAGAFNLTFKVTDSLTGTNQQSLTLNIGAATPVKATLKSGEVNLAYGQPLAGVSKTNYLSYSGTIPTGLSIDSTTNPLAWQLVGTPAATGTSVFTVHCTDTDYVFNITVAAQVAVNTASLPSGTVGVAYSKTLSATGGVSPYIWSITGTLPAGLKFVNGILSGTPTAATAAGGVSLQFNVTDAVGGINHKSLSLVINAASTSTCTMPTGATKAAGTRQIITKAGTGYIVVGGIKVNYAACTKITYKSANRIFSNSIVDWSGYNKGGVMAQTITVH